MVAWAESYINVEQRSPFRSDALKEGKQVRIGIQHHDETTWLLVLFTSISRDIMLCLSFRLDRSKLSLKHTVSIIWSTYHILY